MSDIVERLLDYSKDDHERLCQGREYTCTCGYDDRRDPLMVEAAKTIESLRAELQNLGQVGQLSKELERLRAEVKVWQGHTKTAVWSDSEECKMLASDNERLRAALRDIHASAKDNHLIANIARAALEDRT